jgi:hypothetical protein
MVSNQAGSPPFVNLGESATAIQGEIFEACEQLNREWLARMQLETALWSDLATYLTSAQSVPEAFEAYAKCLSQQIQMTAEDGQRLLNDYQRLARRLTTSVATRVATRHSSRAGRIEKRKSP